MNDATRRTARASLGGLFSFSGPQRGFTLVELVMLLVLIGIVAAFIAPRMADVTTTRAAAFADKLRADIRHARNLAMAENRRYRVVLNMAPAPGSGYAVVNDANGNGTWGEPGEVARDPAGAGFLLVPLNTGEYAGITVAPAAVIEFDSLGRPVAGGGAALILSPGGATVTIAAGTGAVN